MISPELETEISMKEVYKFAAPSTSSAMLLCSPVHKYRTFREICNYCYYCFHNRI